MRHNLIALLFNRPYEVICLEYFVNGDVLATIPCFHRFHRKCIKEWFKNKNTCPICKTKIIVEIIS